MGSISITTEDESETSAHSRAPSSTETQTVIAGIPTYNEEIAIGSIVHQVHAYADLVIVVDDGSSDQTVPIARAAGATVIEHAENRGKGGAMRTLLDHVQSTDAEPDALVVLDGDGQHVPADIPDVVEPVLDDECDIAIGSRYLGDGGTETPLYRRVGQRVLDLLMAEQTRSRSLRDTNSEETARNALTPHRETLWDAESIGDHCDSVSAKASMGWCA